MRTKRLYLEGMTWDGNIDILGILLSFTWHDIPSIKEVLYEE